jgi:hypothetical protein
LTAPRSTGKTIAMPHRRSKAYAQIVLASLYDAMDNGRLSREEAELGFTYMLAETISYKPTKDRELAARELQQTVIALADQLASDRHGG